MKRETSTYERVMFNKSGKGPMFFSFRMKIRGSISPERLQSALEKVRIEYPLTAVRVENHPDHRQFITTEDVPEYPLKVIENYSGKWTDEVISLLQPPFDNQKGPMARFALLRNGEENEVIAVFQHSVGDGIGALLFLESLLKHLGDSTMKAVAPDEEFWAPMLHRIISTDSMKIIRTLDPPPFLKNKDYTKYEKKFIPPSAFPIIPYFLHTAGFSKEETSKLVAAAKHSGVTVHSYLGAMIMQCYVKEFGSKEGYFRTIQCPVNFRPQLIPGADRMFGLFNGLLTASSDCSPSRTTEEIARDIGIRLREELESLKPLAGTYHLMNSYLDGIADPEEFLDNRDESHSLKYDFSFSNLGRIDLDQQYGDLVLEEIHGPTFSATKGERVIGALTLNGRLFMTMIYDSALFDNNAGTRIWDALNQAVRSLP